AWNSGGLSACRTANETHEGTTWGAVAKKRTTATGLDEQTLSNRPTSCLNVLKRLSPARHDEDTQKRSHRLPRTTYVSRRRNEAKKQENLLDRLTSFRDDTPTRFPASARETPPVIT